MRQTPDKMSAFMAQLKKKMNLKSLVVTLAAIVVFTTTYLLILPAFTLDKDEAMEQGGIDVVAVETTSETNQAEEAVEETTAEPEESAEPKAETGKAEATTETEKPDKTEPAAKPAVKLLTKQKTITAEQAKGDDFEVSAVVDKDAKVPDDVTITATELNKETEDFDYDHYKKDALAALKKDSSDVKGIKSIKFYDISLESESKDDSVEPEALVNVKIAYEDGMKVDDADNVRIVHFAEQKNGEEKAVVLDADENKVETATNANGSKVTEASFNTDGFSKYAVVEVTLETKVITADGKTYTVEVAYGPKAGIPENATLSVREIKKDTDEFYEYYNKALKAAGLILTDTEKIDETVLPTESTVEVHEMIPFMPDARFFDVSIMVDGSEYEPKDTVKVKIEYDDPLKMGKNDEVSAVHFTDEKDELIDAKVSEDSDKLAVTHSQDGFSVTGDVVISMTGDADLNNPESKTAKFTALRDASTNAGPRTIKTVRDNGDGTYKIALDIIGEVEHQSEVTKANVIVILDTSGSMDDSVPRTGHDRWYYAENAVNEVAGTLLGKNGTDGNPNDLIEMALVTFSNTATTRVSSTTSASTIRNALSRINPDGGTNWEDALQEAASVTFNNDGDATYVIFVSDGNPTFRNTQGSYNQYFNYGGYRINDWGYYRDYGVYGAGNDAYGETVRRCYNEALDDAQALVRSGRQLYTIGAFGNVDRMQSLTTGAGAPANHYYSAADADSLSAALAEIAEAIEQNLGFTGVSTTDGITGLTTVNANIVDGQATGFKYYKNHEPWNDAPVAKYENSAVTWDLSSLNEPLEDGVTYTVEFDVWPSQESYDLIADLNNGLRAYNTLPQATKDQINDNGNGTYSLKTNTSLTTTYTKNGVEGTDTWDKGENSMPLPVEPLSIKKIWNNKIDSHIGDDTNSVQLYLTKDGRNYLYGDDAITVAPGTETEWVSTEDIYISVGLISQAEDGSYIVREDGHDYSIAEPESFSYYWNLTADVYRPMSINGTAHYLVLNDDKTGVDGRDYYVIEGHRYEIKDGATTLTATNDRRSNLNLTKVIDDQSDDQGADEDTQFEYTITVNNSNASTGSVSNLNSDHYVWFSVFDPEAGATVKNLDTDATAEDGNTGYYYAASDTPITVKLKAGWNLRFINLPNGTTYSITETVEDGWTFEKAEGTSWNHTTDSADTYNISVTAPTVTGNIPASNHDYTATVTNKWEANKKLTVNKVWNSGDFVTTHGTINVALYKDGEVIEGSVKEIEAPDTSVAYNSISSLDGLEIREVTVTTTGEGDDAVTTVTPIDANGLINVSGETTTIGANATDSYIVTYETGTASNNSRTDTVTNTMPQLTVNKKDMSGNQLAGATFKLTGSDGETALTGYGSITSTDSASGNLLDGIYLSNGTYYLVETNATGGYLALDYKVKFVVGDNGATKIITAATDPASQISITDQTASNNLLYTFNINNSTGVELPMTGGIGTTIFYILGSLLVVGCGIMLVSRRRTNAKK